MVRRPEVRLEIRSLPARAQTIVLWAPETAGPWSAVTMRHISMNWQAYLGNLHRKPNNTGYDAQGFLQESLQTLRSGSRPSLEPQQPQSSPQAYFWLEDLSDGHASIDELLTPLITDTGHKGSRFTDETQLLRHKKRQVHFSLYNQGFQSHLKPTFV